MLVASLNKRPLETGSGCGEATTRGCRIYTVAPCHWRGDVYLLAMPAKAMDLLQNQPSKVASVQFNYRCLIWDGKSNSWIYRAPCDQADLASTENLIKLLILQFLDSVAQLCQSEGGESAGPDKYQYSWWHYCKSRQNCTHAMLILCRGGGGNEWKHWL